MSAQDNHAVFLTESLHILEKATSESSLKLSLEGILKKASEQEQKELKIIQKVFAANLHSTKTDSLNTKSSTLYKEAVNMVSRSKNTALQTWVYTQTGFYFYTYNQYENALPFFLKSSRLLDSTADTDLLEGIEILKRNAYFFGTILEHEKSINYLDRALNLTTPNSKDHAILLNGIGNLYLEINQLNKAESYYIKSKNSALKSKDTLRYAKVLGDLARINIKRKNWAKAEDLLLEDISLSEQAGNHRNTMFARLQLGKMYWEKEDINKAYNTLKKVHGYACSKSYLKGFEYEAAELLLQIAIHQKDNTTELFLRRSLDSLGKIVKYTEGKDAISKISLKTQKENLLWELEAEKAKVEKASLVRLMWIVISILLLAGVILIYFYNKRRLKLQNSEFERKLLIFQYEKIQSEKKLSDTHNSIESYKIYLTEKNQQIEKLEAVIQEDINHPSKLIKQQTNALQQLLSSHLMTNDNWQTFKQTFINEQPSYYTTLLNQLPDLTESNLRILLLHKAGLNNQETAKITGVTIDAVKKAKQRLRKKYGEAVEEFL